MSKDYSLSLRGEAFNSLCADFDTTLRDVLAGMIGRSRTPARSTLRSKSPSPTTRPPTTPWPAVIRPER